ncbi:MAG: hypothetical protein JSU01_21450, partial [Bacteroidetes bacterium]|nr:hypothetical protein [Bacteroidota bacterium]
MRKLLAILILLFVNFSYAQSQTCNCPANEFGYPKAKKADTVFHLSNGRSIALCGYKDNDIDMPGTFFSEFVLAACGEKTIIKFWGAVLNCRLHVHRDTLIVETVDNLSTGKNMQHKWMVWTIEEIYFKN